MSKFVFCFGSNTAGIHGAGAALYARVHHGAILMQGMGRQGNSYAIPTKGQTLHNGRIGIGQPLPVGKIKEYVDVFIQDAKNSPHEVFQITQIGTGHAGFTHEQMAPLFAAAGENCWFDIAWNPWLGDRKYWGTFADGSFVYTPEYKDIISDEH